MKSKIRRIFLFCAIILCLAVLSGCGGDNQESRSSIDNEDMIKSLLEYNETLIGDSTAVRKIVCDILPGNEDIVTYDITLNRLTITYGAKLDEEEAAAAEKAGSEEEAEGHTPTEFKEIWSKTGTENVIFYNASALFALINNLESVQFMVEGYKQPTFTISRVNMEGYYGYELVDFETVSEWQKKITAVYLDSAKVDGFFRLYPLAGEEEAPVDTDVLNKQLLEDADNEQETAEERLQRQIEEQYENLPDEVQ